VTLLSNLHWASNFPIIPPIGGAMNPKWIQMRVLPSGPTRPTQKVSTKDQPLDWITRNRVRTVSTTRDKVGFEEEVLIQMGELMKKRRHKK
jgi:hypothetical protein